MATFPKGHAAFLARQHNAKLLAELDRQPPGPHHAARFEFASPADLRGLPAVGRGCGGGAIRGTSPEAAACR